MSQLDGYFAQHATRGLQVYFEPVPGESTLEPGYVYPVHGADQSAIFGIADRPRAEVVGKRIALKIVSAAETPPGGLLSIVAPEGQQVEGDDGMLTDNATIGTQALGAYREWVCDPDGNWLMTRRVLGDAGAGALEGQIVIQGVPVVIQGVPLVLTPPAPLAKVPAPPPTVLPAVIVPRTPLAPRATSVELEDTFADASLEMTEDGAHFRVAGTLQTAIHSMRFAFALRAQSVSSTSFEEIGVLRFDAASWEGSGTILLVAELEVSKPSQVAELQLFDLAAGAAVGEPLTASTTTASKCMVAVTLSAGERLYSVRLRRVGGSADERVSCRSAAFEVSYA